MHQAKVTDKGGDKAKPLVVRLALRCEHTKLQAFPMDRRPTIDARLAVFCSLVDNVQKS
jgi:hypothetical protein